MDYDKMYFPKTEMLQLVPPPINNTPLITPDDTYSAYADNFDLSLLPNETELPLSPQSDFSSSSSSSLSLSPPSASASASSSPVSAPSPASALASSTPAAAAAAHVSLDYIPTTIYHDPTVTQIKTEKPWSDDTTPAIPQIQQRLPPHSSATLNRASSFLYEQLHHQYKLYPSPQPSPPSQDHYTHHNSGPAAIYPPSPCPSIDAKYHHHHHQPQPQQHQIKQEFHILPPSPPESSCGAPSPHSFADIKQEPDEALIDINSLLENSLRHDPTTGGTTADSKPQQDHQLLREYLEDTTFQKKHNLKPLALESLIGGLGVRSDIEPVISLALEHAKREAEETCTKLQISADPQKWTPSQVHAWLRSTVEQFKLPPINDLELKFPEDGTTLSLLTEEEFVKRAPEAGGTIHAQLEIWKLACSDNFPNDFNANPTHNNNNNSSTGNTSVTTPTMPTTAHLWSPECMQNMDMDVSDDEDEEILPPGTVSSTPAMASTTAATGGTSSSSSATPSGGAKPPTGRTGGSHIHLWQFLKELLATPHINGTAIRWIDRSKGVFKIEDSVRVAKLWGRRKNRPAMNYDKLSRSIRQYYKKGIMKKTERSQRLVYQFCHPYSL